MKSLNNIIDQKEQRIAELVDKWKNQTIQCGGGGRGQLESTRRNPET